MRGRGPGNLRLLNMIPAAWTPNFSIQAGWAGRLAGQAVGRQAGTWGHLRRFSTVFDGNPAATWRQAGPEPGTGAGSPPRTTQNKARKNPTCTYRREVWGIIKIMKIVKKAYELKEKPYKIM